MRKDVRADRTYLVYGDAMDVEMRHRVPCDARGPFMLVHMPDDGDHVVCRAAQASHVRAGRPDIGVLTLEELGVERFAMELRDRRAAELYCYSEACGRLGVKGVVAVPVSFPAQILDFLRGRGLGVKVDEPFFSFARRAKTAAEFEGVMRAQRALEHAMAMVSDALGRAVAQDGREERALSLEGEPLTCGRLAEVAAASLREQGCLDVNAVVTHGAGVPRIDVPGEGALLQGEPIVVRLSAADRSSGCRSCLIRTFVKGEVGEDVARCHGLVAKAFDRMVAASKAGAKVQTIRKAAAKVMLGYDDLSAKKADVAADTEAGMALVEQSLRTVGHGVGLAAVEAPFVDELPGSLEEGDLVVLEPGCVRGDVGGAVMGRLVRVGAKRGEVLDECPAGLEPVAMDR